MSSATFDTTWMDAETARTPLARVAIDFGDDEVAVYHTCPGHAEDFAARTGGEATITPTTFGEAADFEEFACRCGAFEEPTVGNRVI